MRELYAHNNSRFHRLDARVKVIFTLAFLIFLNLTPSRAWPAYILFLTMTLSIAIIARLGIGFLLKRALFAFPFVLAAGPIIITGPGPHTPLIMIGGFQIDYSQVGFERFISIAFKAWISVQVSILLAATTRFPDLLRAFQQIKVPKLFIAIIGLMWRYLFLITDEVTRMIRARSSRSAASPNAAIPNPRRKGGSLFWRARVTGGMAGSLFLRSIERSERVYQAMLSRGYDGRYPESESSVLTYRDYYMLVVGFFILALLWALGLFTGG